MMESITHFFDMTAWQKMYFVGMWSGMSWFILEIQQTTKEVASRWPEIKRKFRDELEKQKIERTKFYLKRRGIRP